MFTYYEWYKNCRKKCTKAWLEFDIATAPGPVLCSAAAPVVNNRQQVKLWKSYFILDESITRVRGPTAPACQGAVILFKRDIIITIPSIRVVSEGRDCLAQSDGHWAHVVGGLERVRSRCRETSPKFFMSFATSCERVLRVQCGVYRGVKPLEQTVFINCTEYLKLFELSTSVAPVDF